MEVENIYTDVLDITRATATGLPLDAPKRLPAQRYIERYQAVRALGKARKS